MHQLVFGFIIRPLDYGSLQNTLGFHVWNVTNQANCDGLREELDAVRFRRLLEDPRGGSLQAFGQAPFHHTKLLQQLLLSLSLLADFCKQKKRW